jgi:hypothetical protein
MKLPRRKFLHLAAGAAALPAVSRIASAQAYPTRPVRIIVGDAAGGYISSEEWPTALSTQTNRGILTDLLFPCCSTGGITRREAIVENMNDAETKHVIGTVLLLAVHCVAL